MPAPHHPSRRALLGATGVGLLAVTSACDLGPLDGADTESDGPHGGTAHTDPDDRLLADARARISAAAGLVEATTSAHPGLAGPLADLGALHATHAAALGGEPENPEEDPAPSPAPTSGATTTGPQVPDVARTALTHVLTEERTLADALAIGAREAHSGQFARLLATMSAGVAQQVHRAEESA